ncbi:MC035 [Molluscum contagiosum virus subtype 2]|uniref:MC035 n=2 Tax=Molluscum contagiosum virus TaxID=10279 RepID=A0A3G2VLI1_MCV2|nr:MC035 [Molluscum contagiosum virus subtype 2]QHW16421.1 MC035R [Molluscum contagiosum virus]AYO88180.1 MC035 [Molluscum contagiosum virus subtype 2]QHW16595.1 MC035R [Molluscum contagiosum virus]QHW17661.1 MC035R [Molluscum contagiosum virus]
MLPRGDSPARRALPNAAPSAAPSAMPRTALLTMLLAVLFAAGSGTDTACYRKIGLYSLTGELHRTQETRVSSVLDVDARVLAETETLQESFDWDALRSNASARFRSKCENTSTPQVNYLVKQDLVLFTRVNCSDDGNSTDISSGLNGTLLVTVCNMTLELTQQACPATMQSVKITVHEGSITLTLVSGLVSTVNPFVPSENATSCLMAVPTKITYNGSCEHIPSHRPESTHAGTLDGAESTSAGTLSSTHLLLPTQTPLLDSTLDLSQGTQTVTWAPSAENTSAPAVTVAWSLASTRRFTSDSMSSEEQYVVWTNLTVEDNCTVVASIQANGSAQGACDRADITTVLSVVGVLSEYTDALHRLNLTSNNETNDYYECMMTRSPSCFLQSLWQVALHNVMQGLQAKSLTRARRTRSLHNANAHCLHYHFGMGPGVGDHCEDVEKPPLRVRRSDPPRPTPPARVRGPRPGPPKPPPKPKPGSGDPPPKPPPKPKSIVDQVSESLGLGGVLPQGIHDVQLGARGRDLGVAGTEDLATGLREHLQKAVGQAAPTLPTNMNPDDLERAKLRWREGGGPLHGLCAEAVRNKEESVHKAAGEASKWKARKHRWGNRRGIHRERWHGKGDEDSDFEDIEEVRQQLKEMGLGPLGQQHGSRPDSDLEDVEDVRRQLQEKGIGPLGRRRSSSSDSDLEDVEDVRRQLQEKGIGPLGRRRLSSSDSDFEDAREVQRQLEKKGLFRGGRQTGETHVDSSVWKKLEQLGSPAHSPVLSPQVSGTPPADLVRPLETRVSGDRQRAEVYSRGRGTPTFPNLDTGTRVSVGDPVYADLDWGRSGGRHPRLPRRPPGQEGSSAGDYAEIGGSRQQSRGRGRGVQDGNGPLPPIPGEKPPAGRQLGDRPLPSLPNGRRDSPGPKLGRKICKRSLDSLLCGMLGSRPDSDSLHDPVYESVREGPYSLVGEHSRPPATNPNYREPVYSTLGVPAGPEAPSKPGGAPSAPPAERKPVETSPRMTQLAREENRLHKFLSAVSLSTHLSSAQSQLRDVMLTQPHMPHGMAVATVISSMVSTAGGTLALAGASNPVAAAAGLALQGVGMLVDIGTSLYYLIKGQSRPPPVDPVTEKFSTYARYMSQASAGARLCLMPDSDLRLTLAYRHSHFESAAGEKGALAFADTPMTLVYYMRSSYVVYNTRVSITCPIGTLRMLEGDLSAYAVLERVGEDGSAHYALPGIMELLSNHPNASFTCGSEVGARFIPFDQDLGDMQLLRVATPGEPMETESMPSNVCDLFPLKRFYLLAGGCPYDRSQTAITHVTCGTLLRMASWEPYRQRWVLLNPFAQAAHDIHQLFTFSRYDFSQNTTRLHDLDSPEAFCSQRVSSTCYWSEPMILEDVTTCESRIRKIHVELATVGSSGYTSFVLTCPPGSTPFHVSNIAIVAIPQNTRRTAVRFASTIPTTILVSCVHNTNPAYKSDIVMLSFTAQGLRPRFSDMETWARRKMLFDSSAWAMPLRSRTCKRHEENTLCHLAYSVSQQRAEYHLQVQTLPEQRLHEYYHGELDALTLQLARTHFSSELHLRVDVSFLESAYRTPGNLWKHAAKKMRTFSAITITLYPCTSMVGRFDIKYEQILARLLYLGTRDQGNGQNLTFHALNSLNDSKHARHGHELNPAYSCRAHLDIPGKEVYLHCPPLSLAKAPFHDPGVDGICVVVTSSRDHCAVQNEEGVRAGYSSYEAETPFLSCGAYVQEYAVRENFCYYERSLRIPLAHDYDPCSTAMVLGYAHVWLETRIVSPPYVQEFGHDPARNEYANGSLFEQLQDLHRQYEELLEYSSNPVVRMTNKIAAALTEDARKIFRINADSQLMQTAFEADEERLRELEERIENTMQDIFLNTMSYQELAALRRSAFSTRCCVLDGTSVRKHFPLESYLCGSYEDYVVAAGEYRFLLVNHTLVDEAYYNSTAQPWLTCYEITLVPVSTEEQRARVEEALFLDALESVLQDLFDRYDENLTIILHKPGLDEHDKEGDGGTGHGNRAGGTELGVALGASLATAMLLLLALLLARRGYVAKCMGKYSPRKEQQKQMRDFWKQVCERYSVREEAGISGELARSNDSASFCERRSSDGSHFACRSSDDGSYFTRRSSSASLLRQEETSA